MSLWRKKPVVVEAFKWTGGPDQTEEPEWAVEAIREKRIRFSLHGTPDVSLLIDTLEGIHRAEQGDYIIQGVKGELYPCKPDIFEMTYEPAECPPPLGGKEGDVYQVWSVKLLRSSSLKPEKNFTWKVVIDGPDGHANGHGATPAQAYKSAESQLVVKPFLTVAKCCDY